MLWSELYGSETEPTDKNIESFINSELWGELNEYLQKSYGVAPVKSYSKCSAQRGWNIKYQKASKSLCTLYPMEGYFIALVVIGAKEQTEAELYLNAASDYVKKLYEKTTFSAGGRWLMINVTDEKILNDVKNLIAIRKPVNK
ncbi:MAG: DUF3788 domain-containing protein [Eubacteriaceae bacterium]